MSRLEYVNGRFELDSKDPDIHLVKKIRASKFYWNKEAQKYFTHSPQEAYSFIEYASSSAQKVFDRLFIKDYDDTNTYASETLGLYKPQVEGVKFILKQNRSYLADEPGFGKSAQVIIAGAIASQKHNKPILIICPPQLTKTWEREILKWWPYDNDFPSIEVLRQPSHTRHKKSINFDADILLLPDSLLDRPFILGGLYKKHFALIAVDEAHRFKNEKALRSVMLFGGYKSQNKASPGLIYNTIHSVLMSGTPMLNRPMELWPMLYCMAPEVIDFMGKHDFGARYCAAFINSFNAWVYNGSSNESELRAKLFPRFMLRRKLDESELPEKIRRVVYVNRDTRLSDVKGFEKNAVQTLSMQKVMELSESPYLSTYRKDTGIAKVEFIAEYVRMRLDNREDIILYMHHREAVQLAAEALKEFYPQVINGDTPKHQVLSIEETYQRNGGLLIGNLDTLGVGFTLTKATRIVFGEFSWTQKINEQCENRAARRGQTSKVICDYIVFENSLDEKIFEVMYNKESKIRKVIE